MCVHRHGAWVHWRVSTFWLGGGKTLTTISCAVDGPGFEPLVFGSWIDALPTEPPCHPRLYCKGIVVVFILFLFLTSSFFLLFFLTSRLQRTNWRKAKLPWRTKTKQKHAHTHTHIYIYSYDHLHHTHIHTKQTKIPPKKTQKTKKNYNHALLKDNNR